MELFPKEIAMSNEAIELIRAFPIYIKPKTKQFIPELVQKEVLEWLRTLDFAKRFEVFMVNDFQITQTVLLMFRKLANENMSFFLRSQKETLKPIEKPEDFDRFYYSRKDPDPTLGASRSPALAQREALILSSLRVFERERRFDSLCFSKQLIENFESILEVFTAISEKGLFTHCSKLDLVNDWLWELPFWFNLNTFQSLAAWIVALMEREVWKKFTLAKQQSKRKSVEWKLGGDSLLWKENEILQFWKSLEKPSRRKVLSESRTFLHELEQSRGLKPTPESTLAYYWQFLDNAKDNEFIESLFFTRIQQAEELIPLLNGLLLKAINARLSQKITEELIKDEENEKLGKRKKKKHGKKQQPLDSQCRCCQAKSGKSNGDCELWQMSRQMAGSLIHKAVIGVNSSNNNGIPENNSTAYSLRQHLEYETSISVVSDTTRKCRFPASIIKKNRCTSNSREKRQNLQEAGISEITTLLDSNTDFESVADSIYEGSLKNNKASKNKVEPPVFNNKKERNLSHEKYEPDQKDEKKVSECDDFIEVKRKRSVKEHCYITNSACKSSVLKSKKIRPNKDNNPANNIKANKEITVCQTIKEKEEKKAVTSTQKGQTTLQPKKPSQSSQNPSNNPQSNPNNNPPTQTPTNKPHQPNIQTQPVLAKKEQPEKTLEKKLSKEISVFMDIMRPKLEDVRILRGLTLKRLRFILACLFPHFSTDLRVFGSCATGLDLPSSDLDLGLRGFERVHKFEIPNILQFLLENLVFFRWVKDAKFIPTATVPVLKLEVDPLIPFTDFINPNPPVYYLNLNEDFGFLDWKKGSPSEVRIKVDISVESCYEFEDGGFTGIRSTELINQWLGSFKNMKGVALIVKHLFNKKGFNNAYKGGFSSYCLMILLVASLRKLGCEFSSGMGMLRFIEVYGKDFDSKKIGIDLLGNPNHDPFFQISEPVIDNFTVIDPITRAKNITKNVFMSEEILKEIRRWWGIIESLKVEGEQCGNLEDLLNGREDLLVQFLK